MPGIGVVLNPKSRHNLRDRHAATRLARRLGDHGVVREAWSIDELYRIAGDFRHGDALDSELRDGLPQIVQLEGPHDRGDHFHDVHFAMIGP